MSYITREDGEHLVIPSYRDVLSVSNKSQLRKEVFLLSRSYGEFITLQKKTPIQYEIAFSTDTGYLLGESIWHHFKKPLDMIYCEALPNSTEAILVIVKSGSVYLDGSFPVESISEELIIFLTQQNNFEIYIYGNVPISKEPEANKFSFEASSVKSFTLLDKPVFPTLPLLKIYQLQLVDKVLKSQGIGVFPTKPLISLLIMGAIIWSAYDFFIKPKTVVMEENKTTVNPYQAYLNALDTPSPTDEISSFINKLQSIIVMPGWEIHNIKYIHNIMDVEVLSNGGSLESLYAWAQANKTNVVIRKSGISLNSYVSAPKRPAIKNIYSTPKVIAKLVDNLAKVYPGNRLELGDFVKSNMYTKVLVTIRLQDVSLLVLNLIGEQMQDLPIVLHDISTIVSNGSNITGSITIEVLGN